MKKALCILSHKLTEDQIEYLKNVYNVTEIITMPDNLAHKWQNIPPDIEDITDFLNDLYLWIEDETSQNDIVIIQGDFGATYKTVNFAKEKNLIPVYATTKRIITEEKYDNGEIITKRIFKFVRFREY